MIGKILNICLLLWVIFITFAEGKQHGLLPDGLLQTKQHILETQGEPFFNNDTCLAYVEQQYIKIFFFDNDSICRMKSLAFFTVDYPIVIRWLNDVAREVDIGVFLGRYGTYDIWYTLLTDTGDKFFIVFIKLKQHESKRQEANTKAFSKGSQGCTT